MTDKQTKDIAEEIVGLVDCYPEIEFNSKRGEWWAAKAYLTIKTLQAKCEELEDKKFALEWDVRLRDDKVKTQQEQIKDYEEALGAWIYYDSSDVSDVSCMVNYADALSATKQALNKHKEDGE